MKRKEKYLIFKTGIVQNGTTDRILKQETTKGYKRVTLSIEGKTERYLVHRLIAMTFIPNPLSKPCVNHIDGDKLNNDVSNLEWCTYSENEIHSYDVLGKINANRKLSKEAVEDIILNCKKGVNQSNKGNVETFIKKYNVSQKTVLNIINKKYYL